MEPTAPVRTPCRTALRIATMSIALLTGLPALAADDGHAWRQRLEQDARRFHAAIRESHPGTVDPANPGFNAVLGKALDTTLARVQHTRDAGGYWWALREFQAFFDDGHVQMVATRNWTPLPKRWPGFLTRFDGDRQVVAVSEDAAAPRVGAVLVSCDGLPADMLARERLGRFSGRWMLEAQRADLGPRLFIDERNPWLAPLRECVFETRGQRHRITLQWRDMDDATFEALRARVQPMLRAPVGLQSWPGLSWLSLGTFDGNPQSDDYGALVSLVADVQAQAESLREGVIVLDVRGNTGGSSHWSRRIAESLWGPAAVQRATQKSDGVDWRVSATNIQHIRTLRDRVAAAPSPDVEQVAWLSAVLAGLEQAQQQGLALWRQADDETGDPEPATPAGSGSVERAPRVYVVTDSACASACLDAMDLWKALGVIQVGRETSADTLYMEVRAERLPSDLVWAVVPTKVYRGRLRGDNEAYRPDHVYNGDMSDTEALQAWILERVAATRK
ncbi:peptidase S41 [Pseudoxanthomonas sp. PXM01]|uniref:peptidase S41 n=1 Tax=Pseudoxanthomonas sp. PXM01 TaxID=2769295 RepID=UPI0017835BCA|nr:peptidase S41 [Pseudoxanthomonas sp. PXM01]MBD9469155.1 peptidase S41 [Pseudoxanthomonas sp. PXM01]